jgi:hypothetical protein
MDAIAAAAAAGRQPLLTELLVEPSWREVGCCGLVAAARAPAAGAEVERHLQL